MYPAYVEQKISWLSQVKPSQCIILGNPKTQRNLQRSFYFFENGPFKDFIGGFLCDELDPAVGLGAGAGPSEPKLTLRSLTQLQIYMLNCCLLVLFLSFEIKSTKNVVIFRKILSNND